MKQELAAVEKTNEMRDSLCRQSFSTACEAAINEQINVEYSVSYIYHALYSYFDRDNIALPGFAKFFQDASVEERGHAELLMEYQVGGCTTYGRRARIQRTN